MNPPRVYEVTIPRSHRITRIVNIVQSILTPYSAFVQARSRSGQTGEGKLTCESALTSSPHSHPKWIPGRLLFTSAHIRNSIRRATKSRDISRVCHRRKLPRISARDRNALLRFPEFSDEFPGFAHSFLVIRRADEDLFVPHGNALLDAFLGQEQGQRDVGFDFLLKKFNRSKLRCVHRSPPR